MGPRYKFWDKTDKLLAKTMNLYMYIGQQSSEGNNECDPEIDKKAKKPLFIDFIIRIIIARGFCKQQNENFLTSQNLLKSANQLIKLIPPSPEHEPGVDFENTDETLTIETNLKVRNGAIPIPREILLQKYRLHKGLRAMRVQDYSDAKKNFEACLNTGTRFDPRIRKMCLEQLRTIYKIKGTVN